MEVVANMATYNWAAFEVVIGNGTFSTNLTEDWAKRGRKGKVIGQDDHRKLCRILNEEKVQLTYGPADHNGLAGLVDAPMTAGAYAFINAVVVQPIQHRRKFEHQAAKRAYTNAVIERVDTLPISMKKRIFC